ncbi:MAG: hypothetical protein CL537_06130 [Alcanivoracaceae bacterium]|uniref:porin n=1 Tax=Alcanivorax sp. MD8A TaxID=1177157 RepID=UPI000C5F862F|nr:porin [Alcanivorax sp. MD8A]MAX55076.1 hypothetical protein [Alcanivoracaceae bacterium]PNE04233.1 hypothetical protein A15D_00012 [Alcanivorax sp. MD8A]|tara:strand:- start:6962 stop:8245 length:1284 start_codon:yes stop_codon:yes gene_type:complete
MRNRRYWLGALALTASGAVCADQALTMEELDRRLASLEESSASSAASSVSDRISINGFITYGVTRHNVHQNQGPGGPGPLANPSAGEPFFYRERTTDDISHRELSRVGVQINAEINERTKAVMQILARGRDNYDAEAQWAYIDYAITPSLHWRGGRLMLPNSMHSQYLNVGYAYHWAALPSEVYDIVPFDTMDGMDLTWSFRTGNISHDLSAFYGSLDVPDNTLPFTVVYEGRNYTGINLRSRWNDFSTWLSYSHSELSADLSAGGLASASLDGVPIHGNSVGVQYDNGSLVFMAERSSLVPHAWFPERWGGYVTSGYRFGKWMPHVTWGATNSHDNSAVFSSGNPVNASLTQANMVRSKSWTLGLRYDIAPGVDVKLEAQQFYDMSNDKLLETGSNVNGMFTTSTSAGAIERDDPTVYRITVDAVF